MKIFYSTVWLHLLFALWVFSSLGRRTYRVYAMAPSVRRQLFPLNYFFSRTTRPISTKLGRKHACGMGIQICSNKGAGTFWGPIRGKIRKKFINLQKSSSHEPLAGMHWYLAWNMLGARIFNFVQIKSLVSCMASPQGLTLVHSNIYRND